MTIESAISTALVVILGTIAVVLVGRRTDTLAPAVSALVIRLVAAAGIYSMFGLFSPDAIFYDDTALTILEGNSAVLGSGKEGWPQLLAWIYGSLGHYPALGLAINAIAGALTASIAGVAAARIGASHVTAAWLFALLPSGILWSSLLLRESITWLLLMTAAVGFSDVGHRHRTTRAVAIILTGLTLLLVFRGTLSIIVACAGLVSVAFMRRQTLRWAVAAIATVPLALMFTPLGDQVDRIMGNFSIDSVNDSRAALSSQASTGWPVVPVTDFGSLTESLGIAIPRLLLGPFPWEWGVVGPIFAADAVVWIILVILAVRGWAVLPARSAIVFVFVAGAVLAALATTSGNYGTALRLRVQSEILVLPLAAAGFVRSQKLTLLDEPHERIVGPGAGNRSQSQVARRTG